MNPPFFVFTVETVIESGAQKMYSMDTSCGDCFIARLFVPGKSELSVNRKIVTKRSSKIVGFVTLVVLACLCLAIVEARTKVLRHTIDNLVYDNKNHYLPCEKLPTEAEARRIVQEHQDVIRAIEQVNPGFVGVEIDRPCGGKADLVIWYGTHEDRLEIERIIGAGTFFGVPYRLNNR